MGIARTIGALLLVWIIGGISNGIGQDSTRAGVNYSSQQIVPTSPGRHPAAPPSVPMGMNAQSVLQRTQAHQRQQMGYHPPPTQQQIKSAHPINPPVYGHRSQQQIQELRSILAEERLSNTKPVSPFETPEFKMRTAGFWDAKAELEGMLAGNTEDLSLKRAVYLVESAWYGQQGGYEQFSREIERYGNLVDQVIVQNGLKPNNPLAVHWAIQNVLGDTVTVSDPAGEGTITHYPFQYDFEDYLGDADWSKMFVSKALATKSGQCHSLPLIYLLLAERMGVDAYLSLAPNHAYVQFKGEGGLLHNYESTNGQLTSDAWVMGSGYVKQAAIRQGAYMDTLSKRQTIALMLTDLAEGYQNRFGVADGQFILKCTDHALRHFENGSNVKAHKMRNNTYLHLLNQLAYRSGAKSEEDVLRLPEAQSLHHGLLSTHLKLKQLGYEEMPAEMYEAWLGQLEEATQQEENQINHLKVFRTFK